MAHLAVAKARLLHEVYNKYWVLTQEQFAELRAREENTLLEFPITDRSLAHYLIGGLYAEYVNIVNRLNECYDQICQAQKRILIGKLLQSANGRQFVTEYCWMSDLEKCCFDDLVSNIENVYRLNELKMEMNNIELSEFIYLDDILVERKWTPIEVKLLPPMYKRDWNEQVQNAMDPEKRAEVLRKEEEDRLALIEEEKKRKCEEEGIPYFAPGAEEEEQEEDKPTRRKRKKPKEEKVLFTKADEVLTPEQQAIKDAEDFRYHAIKNIQRHERARVSRINLYEMNRNRALQKALALGEIKEIPQEIQVKCSRIIQRAWRAYQERKKQKQLIEKEQFLLGSLYPMYSDKSYLKRIEKFQADRRITRRQYNEEYLKMIEDEKNRILLHRSGDIMEDISDHIREWFREWYNMAETFHEYPPAKYGGTILVIRGETILPEEWLIERMKTKEQKRKEREQLKKLKQKEKEKRKKEAEKRKQDKLKKKAKGIIEYEMKASKVLPIIDEAIVEYNDEWRDLDETDNPDQKVYMLPITLDKFAEVHKELRPIVDEMMRLELKLLKKAAEKDRKKKRPKPKKIKGPKAKKPKVPGGKKKKGKKNKPKKDITADRSYESIIQELIDNGIIITEYRKNTLKDFKGDFNYTAFEQNLMLRNPAPALGDIRAVVTANCINPLSGDGPGCPRSCLIVGPKQSGKSVLVNSILTETESVLFDLRPKHVNKYEGPDGLKMLVHLVMKMAKILQPSVLYIRKCECNFYKKIPPEDRNHDTRRLGKVLFKQIVKQILPGDRVMLIGSSSEPWNAKAAMKKCYDRVILIPKPDYGSIYMWYTEKLAAKYSVSRTFNASPLSLVTKNYSLAAIERALESVLCPTRVITLAVKPLQSEEILRYLQKHEEEVNPKEMEKYNKWFKKTNWGKKKARYIKKELKKKALLEKKKGG